MKYIAKTDFSEYEVSLIVSKYYDDENTALSLWSDKVGPVAMLTVNLEDLEDEFAYIDTNNCPWAEALLTQNGLGEPTGEIRRSGYCVYPKYKLNLEAIKEGLEDD